MTAIERNCKRLLLAYPRWYRRDRGDEIAGTLMEATGPGRSWPTGRDARALILSGLRVRAGAGERLNVRSSLYQSMLLAGVLLLAYFGALRIGLLGGSASLDFPGMSTWSNVVLGLATVVVTIGAWSGPRRLVAAIALIAAGVWLFQPLDHSVSQSVAPALGLVLIAIAAFQQVRLPRQWLWLAVPWFLAYLADWLVPYGSAVTEIAAYSLIAAIVATMAWFVLDVRPLLGVAIAIAVFGAGEIIAFARFDLAGVLFLWPTELIIVTALGFIAAGIWRLRRQSLI